MRKPDEDLIVNWADIDTEAVKRMLAEADAEGGEIPLDEIARRLGAKPRRRR